MGQNFAVFSPPLFNQCFRLGREWLNQSWVLSLEDPQKKMEAWRMEYNHIRPHSGIGDIAVAKFLEITERVNDIETPLTQI
jgi:hypothetical protein